MRSAASSRLLEYIDAIQKQAIVLFPYRAFIFLARPDNGYSPGKLPALDRKCQLIERCGGENVWESIEQGGTKTGYS